LATAASALAAASALLSTSTVVKPLLERVRNAGAHQSGADDDHLVLGNAHFGVLRGINPSR
jgi:hypothetical protein